MPARDSLSRPRYRAFRRLPNPDLTNLFESSHDELSHPEQQDFKHPWASAEVSPRRCYFRD